MIWRGNAFIATTHKTARHPDVTVALTKPVFLPVTTINNYTTSDFFRNAALYCGFDPSAAAEVRDLPATVPYRRQWTERHLQAVWYDQTLRPPLLRTHTGEAVRVEHPGHWNLEEGPDFLGAALRIGSAHRRVTGDIEVHVYPADWTRHGHADDERYRDVIAHVTYYPGVLDATRLRTTTVQISLRDALAARPDFSFDAVDTDAYPYAVHGADVPCRHAFDTLGAAGTEAVLQIAGEARLQHKTNRISALIKEQGPDQALYEEWMAALGYRRNRHAFRRLARAAPLTVLRAEAGDDIMRGYAFLLGISGLMPHRLPAAWDTPTHRFFRTVWDAWWKQRERWRDHILPDNTWCLSGLRPVNHPLRRLMAAAVMFAANESAADQLKPPRAGKEKAWVRARLDAMMIDDPSGFWTHHQHHAAQRTPRAVRLVGRGRAAAVLMNVIVPWMTAAGRLQSPHRALLDVLPAEDESGAVRRASHQFLSMRTPVWHAGSAIRRQGLLQIFSDFCMPDRSGCRACRLPRLLESATEKL